ncbi:MAG: HAMP domain-containing sensor histidine kinase [Myxococcota bacterium]
MNLRTRLIAAITVTTIPMLVGLVVLDALARQQAAEEELYDVALAWLSIPKERAQCERGLSVASRPRSREHGLDLPRLSLRAQHRKPARFLGYDVEGRAGHPDAPWLGRADLEAVPPDRLLSRSTLWNAGDVEILLRTSWPDGGCAFVIARGTKEPWLGAILPPTRVWLAPLVVVLLTSVIALGPVVRRLRRLRAAVEYQAESGYREPVDPPPGDDEVAALGHAFAAAAREVQTQLTEKDRRERALRDFIADTTHDVMIPLTVLQGHLATLRDADMSDAQTLGAAMQEAHYIASLLQNLAVAAKLDAAAPIVEQEPVELGALVERVTARHRPIGRQLGVCLESSVPEPSPWVDADLTMFEQALGNLVYNAVRHNRRGGHVAVFVETTDHQFVAHVVDDGPGIAAAQLDRIRERGVRGTAARTRSPRGQGLGLSIVARVCELHRLKLDIDAADGGGVHARITGPTIEPPASRWS